MKIRLIQGLLAAASAVGFILLLTERKPWDFLAEFGPPDKPREFVEYYGWWAGLVNTILLGLLAATAGWWMSGRPPERAWLPKSSTPRWFWPGVAAALVVLGVAAGLRLDMSLWDDEENSVRRLVCGRFVATDDGMRLKPTTWEQMWWNYERPTNHHLQTALSKLCHETWRAFHRDRIPPFREWVVRLPSYVAGLASILALAGVLLRLGLPRAGLLAALLLAMHPWFIRYTSEARGYALAVCASLLALHCLLSALECGRWKWWLSYAACLLAMLLAFPGMVFLVGALSLLAPVAISMRNGTDTLLSQAARWFVASLVAAMVVLQVMLPCAPQADTQMHQVMRMGLGPRWYANLWSFLFSGIPWSNSDNPAAGFAELRWLAESAPALFLTSKLAALTFAAGGSVVLLARRPVGWLPVLAWVASPFAMYAASRVSDLYLYEWYFVFTVPGLVVCAAVGVDALGNAIERKIPGVGWGLAVLAVAIAGFVQGPARERILGASLQGMREASVEMQSKEGRPAITAQVATRVELYDPNVRHLRTKEEILSTAREADDNGIPFRLVAGNPLAVLTGSPEVAELLSDASAFRQIAFFRGFDPTLDQRVLEYQAGSLQSVHREAVPSEPHSAEPQP
jgi:hypothetical protein